MVCISLTIDNVDHYLSNGKSGPYVPMLETNTMTKEAATSLHRCLKGAELLPENKRPRGGGRKDKAPSAHKPQAE